MSFISFKTTLRYLLKHKTFTLINIIGLAFLLFQEGIITEKDTGGPRLKWGNQEAVEDLIHAIHQSKGIGDRLAEGAKSAA